MKNLNHIALALLLIAALPSFSQPVARVSKAPTTQNQQPEMPPIFVDRENHQVVARDETGRVIWSTRLEGYLGLVRPPHLLYDADRVYLSHSDGITALDRRNGKILWHEKGPNDRMLLSRDLLLATDCSSRQGGDKEDRLVLGRQVTDGKEGFRFVLPLTDFDPLPIEEKAGLFIVQNNGFPGDVTDALMLDRQGHVWRRFDQEIIDAKQTGETRLIMTSHDLQCWSSEGSLLWKQDFAHSEFLAAGKLLILPDKSCVAFLYGRISDSGVQLMRVSVSDGGVIWKTQCDGLGVAHSKYRHEARVTLAEKSLNVVSDASGGKFTETLDVDSGKRLQRTTQK